MDILLTVNLFHAWVTSAPLLLLSNEKVNGIISQLRGGGGGRVWPPSPLPTPTYHQQACGVLFDNKKSWVVEW
jgi:hypothetical protein